MLLNAILIDAETRTINAVQMDDQKPALAQYYSMLECSTIDAVRFENGDTGWVDDEGLLKAPGHFLYLPNHYPQPLATRLVITGTGWNDDGDYLVDVKTTIAELEKSIKWFTRAELRAWLETDEAAHLR